LKIEVNKDKTLIFNESANMIKVKINDEIREVAGEAEITMSS